MKFSILSHPTFYGVDNMLLKRLSAIDARDLDVRHIILVPDRATLTSEKEILSINGGSFNTHVQTFKRFAANILPSYRYINKESGILALTKIAVSLSDKLTCLSSSKLTYGFISNLYDIIGQLKYSCIKPEQLNSPLLPEYLRSKIDDIRLLYTEYEAFLKGNFIDSADKMELLCNAIPYNADVSRTHFYIKDFDNLSIQELNIVKALILNGKSFTAAVVYDDDESKCMLYLNDLYEMLIKLSRSMINDGILKGEEFEVVFDHQMNNRTAFFQQYFMNASITKVSPQPFPKNYTLYSAQTPAEEVRAAADIISNAIYNGEKYDNFTVVLSDCDRYKLSIESVFNKYEIPYFIDDKITLLNCPLSDFILTFFNLYDSNFNSDIVLRFVKNYFFDSNNEDIFAFERFIERYNISHRFFVPLNIANKNEWYVGAENTRAKFAKLPKTLPKIATAKDYLTILDKLFEQLSLWQKLDEFQQTQADLGLTLFQQYTIQVKSKLTDLFSIMKEVLLDAPLSLSLFCTLLSKGMSAVTISIIPIKKGSVEFIEMAKARRHNYQNLIILGANDGIFPIIKGDFKLLNDDNLSALSNCGIDIEPSVRTLNQRERFDIYQLFLEPLKSLFISYSGSAKDADSLKPSVAVLHLTRMFTVDEKPLFPLNQYTFKRFPCPTKQAAQHSLKEQLSEKLSLNFDITPLSPLYYALNSPPIDSLIATAQIEKISVGKQLFLQNSMSMSRIETFYQCPFKHFLQYGLKIKSIPKGGIDNREFGNIIHACLERCLHPYTIDSQFNESDAAMTLRAQNEFDNIINSNDYYASLYERHDTKTTLHRLKLECCALAVAMKNQIENSNYKPKYLETRFDLNNPISIETDYAIIALSGIMDRVDIYKNHAIIIDYKTGFNQFSEKSLLMGLKLQLTTYLSAVENMGFIVDGFYYLYLDNSYINENANRLYFNGRTISDLSIINNIDNLFILNKKSEKLQLRINLDGSLAKSASIVERKQFDKYKIYTIKMYQQAVSLLNDGIILLSPVADCCKYCDYKDICNFGDTIKRLPRPIE
ncbi:MAG: PD-(D/E)XK nuclease family protein [Clostridia bacterium]